MEHETFLSLLKDPAHWCFELFLQFVFDFLIGVLLWPRIKRALVHHQSDDDKLLKLQKDLAKLKAELYNRR
jgi:hypothetical protein